MTGKTNHSSGNHEKLLSGLLKGYRTVVVALLTVGVVALFQTRELVVRVDERLKSVEESLAVIEARQYESRSRRGSWNSGDL